MIPFYHRNKLINIMTCVKQHIYHVIISVIMSFYIDGLVIYNIMYYCIKLKKLNVPYLSLVY